MLNIFKIKPLLLIWLPIITISILHYGTGHNFHWLHDILRRLYYLPILVAALTFGKRGGLYASGFASLLYLPHGLTNIINRDPGGSINNALEILLYNLVALIAGTLMERLNREKERFQHTAEDLAEKIEHNRQLEQHLIRTEKLKALGEMSAGLAHELKNPLASIQGAAEILYDEIPEDDSRYPLVAVHSKELKRMEKLLERFLNFARGDQFQIDAVDLNILINDTITLFQTGPGRGISINFQKNEISHINGNRDKLGQVLLNLLNNAREALGDQPDGAITITTGAVKKHKTEMVTLSVIDNGPGIPEELLQKIFNPFFTTKDHGNGLGLSIVNKIIDQHDGYIEVRSTPGETMITLSLPSVSRLERAIA